VKKKIFSIWSVLLILAVSIAVVVPGCTEEAVECTIDVKATWCDATWEGDVQYTLTGPGAETAPITGTNVTSSFTVDCGNWTCEYVSGGPPDSYLVDITPPSPQEVSDGGTITFTLNFEENQDAWIEWLWWTVNDEPWEGPYVEVEPCDVIDAHFVQGVEGCEGRIVAVNETSRLLIHYLGYSEVPPPQGEPTCGGLPPSTVWVVNDLCAVNKTPDYGNPPEKVSQNTTWWGDYVPKGMPIDLFCDLEEELDVETIWMLEKETAYLKSIRWLGISAFDPFLHPCVLFELVVQPVGPGWYVFSLETEAEVTLMDDDDVNTQNNIAQSPPLTIWVFLAP